MYYVRFWIWILLALALLNESNTANQNKGGYSKLPKLTSTSSIKEPLLAKGKKMESAAGNNSQTNCKKVVIKKEQDEISYLIELFKGYVKSSKMPLISLLSAAETESFNAELKTLLKNRLNERPYHYGYNQNEDDVNKFYKNLEKVAGKIEISDETFDLIQELKRRHCYPKTVHRISLSSGVRAALGKEIETRRKKFLLEKCVVGYKFVGYKFVA